jgi:hypothetical protein
VHEGRMQPIAREIGTLWSSEMDGSICSPLSLLGE